MSNEKTNITSVGSNWGGVNIASQDCIANVQGDPTTQINNSQDLAQAVKDIKALLNQLSIDYPSESSRVLAAKALDEVEKNPQLKSRLLNGIKAGSLAALEKMLDHPVAKFFIEGAREILNS